MPRLIPTALIPLPQAINKYSSFPLFACFNGICNVASTVGWISRATCSVEWRCSPCYLRRNGGGVISGALTAP